MNNMVKVAHRAPPIEGFANARFTRPNLACENFVR